MFTDQCSLTSLLYQMYHVVMTRYRGDFQLPVCLRMNTTPLLQAWDPVRFQDLQVTNSVSSVSLTNSTTCYYNEHCDFQAFVLENHCFENCIELRLPFSSLNFYFCCEFWATSCFQPFVLPNNCVEKLDELNPPFNSLSLYLSSKEHKMRHICKLLLYWIIVSQM